MAGGGLGWFFLGCWFVRWFCGFLNLLGKNAPPSHIFLLRIWLLRESRLILNLVLHLRLVKLIDISNHTLHRIELRHLILHGIEITLLHTLHHFELH